MGDQTTIPDAAGYLVGWRLWTIDANNNDLRSLVIGFNLSTAASLWPSRSPLRATCAGVDPLTDEVPNDHHLCERVASGGEAPHSGGRCGIWAYKSMKDLRLESHNWIFQAVGRVALWGRCVEHELGWRAEYAYPIALWVRPNWQATGDRISKRYHVPVLIYDLSREEWPCD